MSALAEVTARRHLGVRLDWSKFGLLVAFVIMCVVFSLASPHFLTFSNFRNVLRQSSVLFLAAAGQTLVLLTGGIDLSQGSIISVVSIVTALAIVRAGLVAGLISGLLAGVACGLINGLLVGKAKVQPFVATLGMMYVADGMALIANGGQPVEILTDMADKFFFLGGGYLGFIPIPVLVAAIAGVALYVFLKRTRSGRYIYALGGNPEAARLSGINVSSIHILVYVLSGLLCALASILLSARIISGQPTLGGDFNMQSLGATVIGGTALTGGKGGVTQTVVGVLLIGFMTNGLNILGLQTFYQRVVIGVVVILSVLLAMSKKR